MRVTSTLTCSIGACVLSLHHQAQADDKPGRWGVTTPAVSYELKILSVSPSDRVVEHSPISLRVSFRAQSLTAASPPAQRISICPKFDTVITCVDIPNLAPGTPVERTIQTTAPRAAPTPNDVELEAYTSTSTPGSRRLVAQASQPMATAAEYTVAVVGLTPLETRSIQKDTVKISLQASVFGQRSAADDACQLIDPLGPNTSFCRQLVSYGDVQNYDRGWRLKSPVVVGPYRIVPQVDPDLHFSYQLVNMGETYEQHAFTKLMNGLSDAASAALAAAGQSAGGGDWKQAHDMTNSINGMMWQGCDGPLVVDLRTAQNKADDGKYEAMVVSRTEATGYWEQAEPKVGEFADRGYYEYTSKDGCGKNSRYRTVWRITRTSWKPLAGPAVK